MRRVSKVVGLTLVECLRVGLWACLVAWTWTLVRVSAPLLADGGLIEPSEAPRELGQELAIVFLVAAGAVHVLARRA
jgi:hypothetical protein